MRRDGVTDVLVKIPPTPGSSAGARACSGADVVSVEAAVKAMAPMVVGRDPWAREAIAATSFTTGLWDYRPMTGNFAFSGIDMALWDLCGKDCKQPLYNLFGGLRQQERRLLLLSVDRRAGRRRSAVPRRGQARLRRFSTSRSASISRPSSRWSRRSGSSVRAAIRVDANGRWSVNAGAAQPRRARSLPHRLRGATGAGRAGAQHGRVARAHSRGVVLERGAWARR